MDTLWNAGGGFVVGGGKFAGFRRGGVIENRADGTGTGLASSEKLRPRKRMKTKKPEERALRISPLLNAN